MGINNSETPVSKETGPYNYTWVYIRIRWGERDASAAFKQQTAQRAAEEQICITEIWRSLYIMHKARDASECMIKKVKHRAGCWSGAGGLTSTV